jgi:hypothetical protein
MTPPSIDRRFAETFLAAVLGMAVAVALAVGLMSDANGAPLPIGEFDLTTGTFDNSGSAGGTLTLSGVGDVPGALNPGTGWTWSDATTPGTGLKLEGVPDTVLGASGNYTIAVEFSFGTVSGTRRLMWFNASDDGLYVNNSQFAMYGPPSLSDNGTLSVNVPANFVVTRGNGTVSAYQITNPQTSNPTVLPLFSFNDSVSNYLASSNGTMEFFRDNTNSPIEFSSSGSATLIKIWDVPLSGDDLKFAFVPEPATVTLLAVAGGGAMLYLHRRRSSRR